MSALLATLERLGDRLNPILVKEVRQTLRGRYFRVSFWFTLCAASVFSMGWLVFQSNADNANLALGAGFYMPTIACLLIATHALVPFSAFVAMGAEWDENTYDLLVLSNLRPHQIVLGKVFAAGIQALLFYSAFVPFLVFAFLLRGIDLLVLLVTLGGSMITSFTLACLAVSLSSLSRQRFARVLLMVLLGAFLAAVPTGQGTVLAAMTMRFPGSMHTPEALPAVTAVFSLVVAAGVLFVLIGGARLAHPEENRSTALRIYSLALPAFGYAWAGYLFLRFDNGMGSEENLAFTLAGQAFLAVAALFFATEPEPLGRRVRKQVPRRRVLALLATPFLPGGARGLLWYIGGNAMLYGGTLLMARLSMDANPRYHGLDASELQVPIVAACFGLVYLGLPSLFLSSRAGDARFRLIARVAVLLLVVASVFLPALVGFFFDAEKWTQFEHPFNPFLVLANLAGGHEQRIPLSVELAYVAGTFVLVASLPRLFAGVREVLAESLARDARQLVAEARVTGATDA